MIDYKKIFAIGATSAAILGAPNVLAVDLSKYQGDFVSQCAQVDDAVYVNGTDVNIREFFSFNPIHGSPNKLSVSVRQEIFSSTDSSCAGSPVVRVNGSAEFTFIDEVPVRLPDFPVLVDAARVDIDFGGWVIEGSPSYNSSNDTFTINGVVFRADDLDAGQFKQLVHTDSFFRFGDDDDAMPKDDQGYPTFLQEFSDIDVLARDPFPTGSSGGVDPVDRYIGKFVGECEFNDDALFDGMPVHVIETFEFSKVSSSQLGVTLNSYYFPGAYQYSSCPIGEHGLKVTTDQITVDFNGDMPLRTLPGFGIPITTDGVTVSLNGFPDIPPPNHNGQVVMDGFVFDADFFEQGEFKTVFFVNDDYLLMSDDEETDYQEYGMQLTDILRRVGDRGLIESDGPDVANAYDFEDQFMACTTSNEILYHGSPVRIQENLNLVAIDNNTLNASLLWTIYDQNEQSEWCDNDWVEPLGKISITGATINLVGHKELFTYEFGNVIVNKVTVESDGYDGFRYLRNSNEDFVTIDGLTYSVELLTEAGYFQDLLYLEDLGWGKKIYWGNDSSVDEDGFPLSLNTDEALDNINQWNPLFVNVHRVNAVVEGLEGGQVTPDLRYVFDGMSSEFTAYSVVDGVSVSAIEGCEGAVSGSGILFGDTRATFYGFGPVTDECSVVVNFAGVMERSRRSGLPIWLLTLDR